MKTMKKAIACFLVVAMFLTAAPLSGFVGLQFPDLNLPELNLSQIFNKNAAAAPTVASGTCGDNLTWTLDTEGTLTIDGTGDMKNYSFDSAPWYSYSASIKNVVITDDVTTIGDSAFRSCASLATITIEADNANYSSDEYGALFNKDKTTLIQYPIGNTRTSYTIPDSVTNIGNYAFFGCSSLASITIPDSVTSIGDSAFSNCDSLASITIPDSVTSIGERAFFYCDSLATITIEADNANYSSDECGVLFNKDKSMLIQYPIGNTRTSYTIPGSVTSIGGSAFNRCTSLTSVTIPDSVTSIGDSAFYASTALNEIFILNPDCTIDDQFTTIDSSAVIRGYDNSTAQAYAEKYERTFVSLSGNGKDVILSGEAGDNAYFTITRDGHMEITGTGNMYDYSKPAPPWNEYAGFIKTVFVADGITSIGSNSFYVCVQVPLVTIPNSVTSIGDSAFSNCDSLASITIPDSVTSIGDYAFSGCTSLASITVDANNANYSSDANGVLFNKDKTTLIQYPIGNTKTSYTIPDSVTIIGYGAFSGCTSLANITIPDSVTSIGDSTFSNCDSLESVTFGENSQLTSIGDFAFAYCTSLASITFGENSQLTSIGSSAFSGCTSLASITIPVSVTSIGYSAFRSCDSLASITIPDRVTSIGDWAFSGCTSLACITIPDSVTSIGSGAFYNTAYYNDESNWLDGVLYIDNCLIDTKTDISGAYVINNDTRVIASGAFFSCDSLASITIPDSVTSIGDDAFYNTAYYNDESNWLNGVLYIDKCLIGAKTEISGAYVINNDTRVITSGAFSGCASLESVTMPDSVTEITYGAFRSCTSLTEITLPDSVTSISDQSFNGCSSLASITIPNPNCEIYDSADTISACAVIYGYPDSTAQAYAEKYNRTFVALDADTWMMGDIDHDGEITAGDARLALRASVGSETLTEQQKRVADVDQDGEITAGDARLLLRASVGLEDPRSWFDEIA